MSHATRLFGFEHAFDHAATLVMLVMIGALLLLVPALYWLLARLGRIDAVQRTELQQRYLSWLILTPTLLVPILLGAAWTILGVALLSLLCCREYARATGLFREKMISLTIVLGIFAVTFTAFDHWYRLFVALVPLTSGLIAAVATLRDEPKGYIQRVALGVFGFILFGSCLGHLGYLANDIHYRPILIFVLLCVEMNDVFAFAVGRTVGGPPLAPNTSPRKTIAGAVGALVLTTLLVLGIGPLVFTNTALESPGRLAFLGVLISFTGQLSDLMLSSIKRDLGIKDLGVTLPGHGGLLDRFDSLILAAPTAFHLINYFVGVAADQTPRILTGG